MFFIFKKEKILAYIISISTVALLFIFSMIVPDQGEKETVEVSSNESTVDNTMILNEKS